MEYHDSGHRLDDIDRQILHELMQDARNVSATAIAAELNVSGATVRNRIHRLEDRGIIRRYTTQVDFELAGGHLTNLYLCDVPIDKREALAHEARVIPGVINVRSLMTGRRNLHVLAVGEDTRDLRRIAHNLSDLGIDIEDEELVEDELHASYTPFSPEDGEGPEAEPSDFISLTGGASILKVTVDSEAAIAGMSLEEAGERGVLDERTLVIAIERDDEEITPHGNTVVRPDDIVTLLSRAGADTDAIEVCGTPGSDRERTAEEGEQ